MKNNLICCLLLVITVSCTNEAKVTKLSSGTGSGFLTLNNSVSAEPISLLYNNGIYNLFYIHSDNIKSNVNNYVCNIGNAISNDLINWRVHSPDFLHKNTVVYKGGIIKDINNITGFGSIEIPPLIALLIMMDHSHGNPGERKPYPVLAYSKDNGISWTIAEDKINFPDTFINYPQNVNIFWHQISGKWIMSLGLSNYVLLYSSKDLFSWDFESSYMPDFFKEHISMKSPCLVPLDDGMHWALFLNIESLESDQSFKGFLYLIGYFDGHHFTNISTNPCLLDYGNCINGGIVSVGPNNTNIVFLWIDNDTVNSMFRCDQRRRRILLPRQIESHYNENNEIVLSTSPVEKLNYFLGRLKEIEPVNISEKNARTVSGIKPPLVAELKFNTSEINRWNFPSSYGIILRNDMYENIKIGYNTSFKYYFITKSTLRNVTSGGESPEILRMPFNHSDSTMIIKLLVYNSMVELYTNNDLLVMSGCYSVGKRFNKLDLFSENGGLNLLECKINSLKLR